MLGMDQQKKKSLPVLGFLCFRNISNRINLKNENSEKFILKTEVHFKNWSSRGRDLNFATINVLLVPYIRIVVFEIRKIVACYEIQAGLK